jgi:hypothetical protein
VSIKFEPLQRKLVDDQAERFADEKLSASCTAPWPLTSERNEGGVHDELPLHEALSGQQRSETTHTLSLSQGSASC